MTIVRIFLCLAWIVAAGGITRSLIFLADPPRKTKSAVAGIGVLLIAFSLGWLDRWVEHNGPNESEARSALAKVLFDKMAPLFANQGHNGTAKAGNPEHDGTVKASPGVAGTTKIKRSAPCKVMFLRDPTSHKLMAIIIDETDGPIDNVTVRIMRSHAAPELEADQSLANKEIAGQISIGLGTITSGWSPIIEIPDHLMPNNDKPTMYQISIITRYEQFAEELFVSPNSKGSFDQGADISSLKTHEPLENSADKVMRAWKNWPEWWK
jgi:hypothetical protein